MTVRKPNIERKAESLERQAEQFVEQNVRPYLQRLLNEAQSRLKHRIRFIQGMGSTFLAFAEVRRSGLEFDGTTKHNRIAAWFPELAEFLEIVDNVEDRLRCEVGDMRPTIEPLPPKMKPSENRAKFLLSLKG